MPGEKERRRRKKRFLPRSHDAKNMNSFPNQRGRGGRPRNEYRKRGGKATFMSEEGGNAGGVVAQTESGERKTEITVREIKEGANRS